MGLLTRLRGHRTPPDQAPSPPAIAETKSFAPLPGSSILPLLGGLPTSSGLVVSESTSMRVSTVYSCCRIRSRDLARCTPQILRDDGTGNKSLILDHPLAKLFERPNRVQSWFEFAEQLHVSTILRANGYAVILRDRRGNPVELIPMDAGLVTVFEAPDGSIFYQVARAGMWLSAVLADQPIMIPSADMLHIRDLSFNSLVGVSRIALARDAIGLAMVQEQQAARWAGNGARPSGILQTNKTLSQAAADRLKSQWQTLQAGLQNTGSTAVLEDGVEWKPMGLSSVDLEFMDARLTQVKEIARFFEIPLHKLGENENLPRASISELNSDYVQNVVMSDATRWEQKLALTFGLDAEGLEVKFDERGLLRADLATMINSARAGVLSGLLTQNEGRAYIGYGPVPGGDRLLAPMNLAPNGSAIDGVAPDGAGRPPAGELPGAAKNVPEGLEKIVSAAVAAAIAGALKFNPDQPRDAHGRWSGGSDDDTDDSSQGTQAAPKEDERSAVTHEIKLVVAGLALTASAALAVALAPEEGAVGAAGAVAWTIGKVAPYAQQRATAMFQNAGALAAKHILNDMSVDTSGIEHLVAAYNNLWKSLDPHDAKLAARLVPMLEAVADYARQTLVAQLGKDYPHADADRMDAATSGISEACDAYKAKLATLPMAAP